MLPPEVQQQVQQIEQQAQRALAELQSQVTVEQVAELLKSQRLRPFVLDIETDSTIEPDQIAEKMARKEYAEAVAPVIAQGVQAMQLAPELGPFVAESIRYVASGFKMDRSMDEAIDKLAEDLENYQPPQDQGESPELAMLKVQVEQVKAQAAQAKGEADIQIAQLKLQSEQAKAQMNELEARQTEAETRKTEAETQKIIAETGLAQREADRDDAQLQIDAHAQQQDRQLQREGMAHDAQQTDRQLEADKQARADEGRREDKRMAFEQTQAKADSKRADQDSAAKRTQMQREPKAD